MDQHRADGPRSLLVSIEKPVELTLDSVYQRILCNSGGGGHSGSGTWVLSLSKYFFFEDVKHFIGTIAILLLVAAHVR